MNDSQEVYQLIFRAKDLREKGANPNEADTKAALIEPLLRQAAGGWRPCGPAGLPYREQEEPSPPAGQPPRRGQQ